VVTSGGGYPLDQNFYQTVKGICGALPVLGGDTKLVVISCCNEGLGSDVYSEIMLKYDNDWKKFLKDIAENDHTMLDQWEFQMQCRVLKRIGIENLLFVSDGIAGNIQEHISVTPVLGEGNVQERVQRFLDEYLSDHCDARMAVIPDGPYTMIKSKS
jgi:lactate racemase